jgi:hypothetical protein
MQSYYLQFFDKKVHTSGLQDLYEAIYQTPIDKGNFRKRLFHADSRQVEYQRQNVSKTWAHYYAFNEKVYHNYREGIDFTLMIKDSK